MKTEKNLISLKEASKISGYSSDYIGQLIRSGKIPGKQVYANIAWMTTADAVLTYKNKGKNRQEKPSLKDRFLAKKLKIKMELNIIKLVLQNFRSALPLIVSLILIFSLLIMSILYFFLNSKISNQPLMDSHNIDNFLTF